jgi:hypothetical protein
VVRWLVLAPRHIRGVGARLLGGCLVSCRSLPEWVSGQGFSTRRKNEGHGGPRRRESHHAVKRLELSVSRSSWTLDNRPTGSRLVRGYVCRSGSRATLLRGASWPSDFLRDKYGGRANEHAVCTLPVSARQRLARAGETTLGLCRRNNAWHPVHFQWRGPLECYFRLHRQVAGRVSGP